MLLNELAKKYKTDKKIPDGVVCQNGSFGHSYTKIYEEILKNKKIHNLLEIGVSFGGSIKMWDDFFRKKCNITGVDIEEKRFKKKNIETKNIRIKIGSQNDVNFLKSLCDRKYDIIIDDGSHKSDDQIISFNNLFDTLNDNGIYIIEDLHVAKRTVEIFKSVIIGDEYHKSFLVDDIIKTIKKIEFYELDKFCVIYKI